MASRIFLLLWIFLAAVPFGFAAQYASVVEIAGSAEMLTPAGREWKELRESDLLRKNVQLRTGNDGFVEIALDRRLESMLRLSPKTTVVIQNDSPLEVRLIEGEILFSLTSEPAEGTSPFWVRLRTPNLTLRIESAGCLVRENRFGTSVFVFEEKAEVLFADDRDTARPFSVDEGFKLITGRDPEKPVYERLKYDDYKEWQIWSKKLDEMRDDLAAEIMTEEQR